jgi:competence protein ComFC
MPLHWLRQWRRGFNQSELLANALARRLGIPVINAVRRIHNTQTQTGLSNSKRRENVAGAFRVKMTRSFPPAASRRRPTPVTGLRILLVDDVMTTGATASACAATLKRAGAKSVTLLTIARVDRRFAAVATKSKSMGASQ